VKRKAKEHIDPSQFFGSKKESKKAASTIPVATLDPPTSTADNSDTVMTETPRPVATEKKPVTTKAPASTKTDSTTKAPSKAALKTKVKNQVEDTGATETGGLTEDKGAKPEKKPPTKPG
jgi:hypothetical protein